MAEPIEPTLTGWRSAYIIEAQPTPGGALRWIHTGTAGAFDDVQVFDSAFDAPPPALTRLTNYPRERVYHQAVDQPTHAAGALFLDREILVVRAAVRPRTGSQGADRLSSGSLRAPSTEAPLVFFELSPEAQRFELVDRPTGMPEQQALALAAGSAVARAHAVRQPGRDWALAYPDLRGALLAGSEEYLAAASQAMSEALSSYLPGGSRPDHVVIMREGWLGSASDEESSPLDFEALANVADGAMRDPKALGLAQQPTLHGDRLAAYAEAQAADNHPGRRALGNLLRGASAYAAETRDGYTVVLLNSRPEGFPPFVNHVLPRFTEGLSSSLRRDPETGLVLHRTDHSIGPLERELARDANRSGNGVGVIGIQARVGRSLDITKEKIETAIRQAGGQLLRVEGRSELLVFAPAEHADELTARVSSEAARVSLVTSPDPTQRDLARAVGSAFESLLPATAQTKVVEPLTGTTKAWPGFGLKRRRRGR